MEKKRLHITQYCRKYHRILLTLVMLLFVLLGEGITHSLSSGLSSQQLATRWSDDEPYAQVSCFFSPDTSVQESQIVPLKVQIQSALSEAAVEASQDTARTYVLAYSAVSKLFITGNKNSVTVNAYGVSEDFFLFHPLEVVSGSLVLAGGDDEADTIVLDEMAAWQLFGATNVAGMTVDIGGTAYVISGVVKSETGIFSEQAGAGEVTVYVPYRILKQYDDTLSVQNIELLTANPVKQFGIDTLKDGVSSVCGLSEEQYRLVENSARYSLSGRLETLRNIGVRSMQTDGIVYPYWENRARAVEDVTALILALEIALLCYPVWNFACLIHCFWKNKKAVFAWLWEHIIAMIHQIKPCIRYIEGQTKNKKSIKSNKNEEHIKIRVKKRKKEKTQY